MIVSIGSNIDREVKSIGRSKNEIERSPSGGRFATWPTQCCRIKLCGDPRFTPLYGWSYFTPLHCWLFTPLRWSLLYHSVWASRWRPYYLCIMINVKFYFKDSDTTFIWRTFYGGSDKIILIIFAIADQFLAPCSRGLLLVLGLI